jgi:predicted DNA-binding transcriptional regulator YafY
MGVKNIYERFIWFDTRVRAGKHPNATSLAAKFEISPKTAQRDIEFMRCRLRCPLEYDSRKKGYFYEDGTFSLPMVYLSSGELLALMLAKEILEDISGGCLGNEITSIVEKITNVLSKHSARGNDMAEAVSFQSIGYSPAPEKVFKSILEGCLRRRELTFKYYSPASNETNVRTVCPYHLFNYMGTWHLVAYCHLRRHMRDFALSRISDVEIQEDIFDMPSDFNVEEYFRSSFGLYKGGSKREVTIRFGPEKAKWVKGQIWHKEQKLKELKDGSIELSFEVAGFSEIMREVLRYGDGVEVVKPKDLRELVIQEAKNILRTYKGNGSVRTAPGQPAAVQRKGLSAPGSQRDAGELTSHHTI